MCAHTRIDNYGHYMQCKDCRAIFVKLEYPPLIVNAAQRLFEACERAIENKYIDARSEIADAALDYRQEWEEWEESYGR